MNIHKATRCSYSASSEYHSAHTAPSAVLNAHTRNRMLNLLFAPSVPSLSVARLPPLHALWLSEARDALSRCCKECCKNNSNLARFRKCEILSVITLCCTILAPPYPGFDLILQQPWRQASHRLCLATPNHFAAATSSIRVSA